MSLSFVYVGQFSIIFEFIFCCRLKGFMFPFRSENFSIRYFPACFPPLLSIFPFFNLYIYGAFAIIPTFQSGLGLLERI